jgi:hypothetical protein
MEQMMPKTAEQLRNQARSIDRRQRQVESYVGWIRHRGCALHVYYVLGKPVFTLSDGTRIPEALGFALAKHPNLVAVDPPLTAGGLPQTFRFVE